MEPVLADDEAVAAFARDGVVCLRWVLADLGRWGHPHWPGW
jgi:hypothetical protein